MIVKSFTKAIKGISLITAGVFSFSVSCKCASWRRITNDGAMFYINTGGVVFVERDMFRINSTAGILVNLGTLDIDRQHCK
jgi:hypothetical protein